MHKVCQNVTIFFQIYWGIVTWNSLSHIHIFATAWAVACQAPLSMQFSSQEYWSGLPFPFPGDLPDPEIEPGLLYCKQTLYHLSHQGSPYWGICHIQIVAHISVHFSSSVSSSLRPHGLCHIRLSCPSPIPQAYWKSCLSSGDVIQPSHPLSPLLHLPSIFPSIRVFFWCWWVSFSHQVAKVLELQLQHQSF